MHEINAEVLNAGHFRFLPGVRYLVFQEFQDDDGTAHPVGETWTYCGYSKGRLSPAYTIAVRTGKRDWTFRLSGSRFAAEWPSLLEQMERFVAGPVVSLDEVLSKISPEGRAAYERVRGDVEMQALPRDSAELIQRCFVASGNYRVAIDRGGDTPQGTLSRKLGDLFVLRTAVETMLQGEAPNHSLHRSPGAGELSR